MWALQEILSQMSLKDDVAGAIVHDSTAIVDAGLANSAANTKSGLLVRAPGYINQRLIDTLDMFTYSTSALHKDYSHKASQVKSPTESFHHTLEKAKGSWEREFQLTLSAALLEPNKLQMVGAFESNDRGTDNSAQLVEFYLNLFSERAMRVLPELLQYPGAICVIVRSRH